jgi:hypothetical protein
LPNLYVSGELVNVNDWITYSGGQADIIGPAWFAVHCRREN